MIHGSNGEVAAPLDTLGVFYTGKWVTVLITKPSPDEDVPLEVREAMVGLKVDTIFTVEQIKEQTGKDFGLPPGSRLTYAPAVIEALAKAGKVEEAEILEELMPKVLDMYSIPPGTYEVVQ
ncbi:MAG: hypothetical protein FJZ04_00585 [Candidatus Moranbacteria bacterium]|nr:hypothetical protein [Candidatus Moranbacteria bacterium]